MAVGAVGGGPRGPADLQATRGGACTGAALANWPNACTGGALVARKVGRQLLLRSGEGPGRTSTRDRDRLFDPEGRGDREAGGSDGSQQAIRAHEGEGVTPPGPWGFGVGAVTRTRRCRGAGSSWICRGPLMARWTFRVGQPAAEGRFSFHPGAARSRRRKPAREEIRRPRPIPVPRVHDPLAPVPGLHGGPPHIAQRDQSREPGLKLHALGRGCWGEGGARIRRANKGFPRKNGRSAKGRGDRLAPTEPSGRSHGLPPSRGDPIETSQREGTRARAGVFFFFGRRGTELPRLPWRVGSQMAAPSVRALGDLPGEDTVKTRSAHRALGGVVWSPRILPRVIRRPSRGPDSAVETPSVGAPACGPAGGPRARKFAWARKRAEFCGSPGSTQPRPIPTPGPRRSQRGDRRAGRRGAEQTQRRFPSPWRRYHGRRPNGERPGAGHQGARQSSPTVRDVRAAYVSSEQRKQFLFLSVDLAGAPKAGDCEAFQSPPDQRAVVYRARAGARRATGGSWEHDGARARS